MCSMTTQTDDEKVFMAKLAGAQAVLEKTRWVPCGSRPNDDISIPFLGLC